VPISSVVVKADTTAVKEIKMPENADEKNAAPKSDKKYECVFVKAGDKVKLKIITTGIQDDTYIEVLSGLKKGEVIVTGPYTLVTKELNPGDKVYLKEKAGAKSKDKS
jgi:HlyD family secretion protein